MEDRYISNKHSR